MRWHEEQDYAQNSLLLSAVLWELLQIKLASDANASSSVESDEGEVAIPRHLCHWGNRDHLHRGSLNMQSRLSSKEKHIEQGLCPQMGLAMATGLNVTSQREDLAKRHNPCLPIDRMGLFVLWWERSWDTVQPSGIWRSRKQGKFKDSEEKCCQNYLGAVGWAEGCISREGQTVWAAKSFVAGPHPTHPLFFWALPFSFKDSSFSLTDSQDGEQRPCPPTARLLWADTALWPHGICRPDPAFHTQLLAAGRDDLQTSLGASRWYSSLSSALCHTSRTGNNGLCYLSLICSIVTILICNFPQMRHLHVNWLLPITRWAVYALKK